MKRNLILIILIIISISLLSFTVFNNSKKSPQPSNVINRENSSCQHENLCVTSISDGSTVASTFLISGKARKWYFEGSFPVKILDKSGNTLVSTFAQAQGDWMTSDFVPFESLVQIPSNFKGEAIVRLEEDNPAGDEEKGRPTEFYDMPIIIGDEQVSVVKLFFSNSDLDKELSCDKVFAVNRIIPRTQSIARSTFTELLKGPTGEEEGRGFQTSIDKDASLKNINIKDGTLFLDFSGIKGGGSCRIGLIKRQIEETARQFETIKNVSITIDGISEDEALQP